MNGFKLLLSVTVASGTFAPGFIQAQEVATPPAGNHLALTLGRSDGGHHLTLVTSRYRAAPTADSHSGPRAEGTPWAVSTNRAGLSADAPSSLNRWELGLSVFAPAASGRRSPGVALMIVGAAGIVTGLLVDESAITIAGAALGGIGLYLYLR